MHCHISYWMRPHLLLDLAQVVVHQVVDILIGCRAQGRLQSATTNI